MPGPRVTHRYPFAPLAEMMGMTEHAAAVTLGLSGSTEQEYRRDGVSEFVADRLACKAGLPAAAVWPEILADAIDAASRSCDECDDRFVPRKSDQRFCSKPCRLRFWANEASRNRRARYEANRNHELARERAKYWADPERARARRRAQYAANAEVEKAKARDRRAARKQTAA